ncbi:MAG: Altered inheritance of mitochondria protein 32 [Peltula sp. TS41687]|nr:MAG: Altered inheritance of mitochondria protein 32 [Peltula sp. TS41687]
MGLSSRSSQKWLRDVGHGRLLSRLSDSVPSSRVKKASSSSFHVIQPAPSSCSRSTTCSPTPLEGLEIDYRLPLNGTMAPYAQHVVICTGKRDWKSRIEDDEEAGNYFVRTLKGLLGRGGKYSDPYNNILITNSSFSREDTEVELGTASAYLFPGFRRFPSIPMTPTAIEEFVQGFVLPEKAHAAHQQRISKDDPSPAVVRLRQPQLRDRLSNHEIQTPFVLICGHAGRDRRCGIMGPLLEAEFRRALLLLEKNEDLPPSPGTGRSSEGNEANSSIIHQTTSSSTQVGLISHIGGHKFAGNLIIYIPPDHRLPDGTSPHPLSAKGIWYGRVQPKHVEGIVNETIRGGGVIRELFRGGVGRDGEVLRL